MLKRYIGRVDDAWCGGSGYQAALLAKLIDDVPLRATIYTYGYIGVQKHFVTRYCWVWYKQLDIVIRQKVMCSCAVSNLICLECYGFALTITTSVPSWNYIVLYWIPVPKASNSESASMSWRHHVCSPSFNRVPIVPGFHLINTNAGQTARDKAVFICYSLAEYDSTSNIKPSLQSAIISRWVPYLIQLHDKKITILQVCLLMDTLDKIE